MIWDISYYVLMALGYGLALFAFITLRKELWSIIKRIWKGTLLAYAIIFLVLLIKPINNAFADVLIWSANHKHYVISFFVMIALGTILISIRITIQRRLIQKFIYGPKIWYGGKEGSPAKIVPEGKPLNYDIKMI